MSVSIEKSVISFTADSVESIDPNLLSENIANGVTIHGVEGNVKVASVGDVITMGGYVYTVQA